MRTFNLAAIMILMMMGAVRAGGVGARCGGIAGIECGAGLWCEPDAGRCNVAVALGTCVEPLAICTQDYRPVCGCDGWTYGNDCGRRAQRIAEDHQGRCGG